MKPGQAGVVCVKVSFPLITFSLVNRFISYSHTLLLRSRPFQQHRPWPSDDLDIQHCSLTICVKVLFFSYNLFISCQIYFILSHIVALVETFTLRHATLRSLNDVDFEPLRPFFTYKDLAMYFFNVSIFEWQSTDADIDNQDFTIGPLFPSKPS